MVNFGSDCKESMLDGSTCKVTCDMDLDALGEFRCSSGRMAGFVMCVNPDESDLSVQPVEVVTSFNRRVFEKEIC